MQENNNRSLVISIVTTAVFIIIVIIGIVFFVSKIKSSVSAKPVTPTVENGIPIAKIVDLSSGTPDSQKTIVIIEMSDSSFVKVILPTYAVEGYIEALPQGSKFISKQPFSQKK